MLIFFRESGSSECQLLGSAISDEEWSELRVSASRLLAARGQQTAAALLDELPFEVRRGTNAFQDEFCVLYMALPVERYVQREEEAKHKVVRVAYGQDRKSVV